jgi:hypothetical protein
MGGDPYDEKRCSNRKKSPMVVTRQIVGVSVIRGEGRSSLKSGKASEAILHKHYADVTQLVECCPSKSDVASSNLVVRSKFWPVRLSVRTPGFQPGKRGSTPLRAAKVGV